jgi:hypothetical protein
MDKYFVFRNYSWIAGAVASAAIVVIVISGASGREGLIASTLGAALGFCYFAQKQKLEELRLFKELFTEFNRRYDEMNDRLADIRKGNRHDEARAQKALVDYFNLCAEEHLFFEEGFIHRAAWRSWCRGMLYYLEDDGIRQVWDEEVGSDSYYGLTAQTIRDGAALASDSKKRSKSAPA